jgi:hypothetical protein
LIFHLAKQRLVKLSLSLTAEVLAFMVVRQEITVVGAVAVVAQAERVPLAV